MLFRRICVYPPYPRRMCLLLLSQCRRLHPAVALTLLDVHPHLRLLSVKPCRAAMPIPVDGYDGEVRSLC